MKTGKITKKLQSIRKQLIDFDVNNVIVFYEGEFVGETGNQLQTQVLDKENKSCTIPFGLVQKIEAALAPCALGDQGRFEWDLSTDVLKVHHCTVQHMFDEIDINRVESTMKELAASSVILTPKEGWALAKMGCEFNKPISNSMIVEAKRQARLNALIEFWQNDLQAEAENSPVGHELTETQLAKVVERMEKFANDNDNGKIITYGDITDIIEEVVAGKVSK